MSSKNASFKTLLEDVKVGFKFALKNFISFFLGMIGVLILTGVLMGIIAAISVGIFFALAGNLSGVINWMIQIGSQVNNATGMIVVGAMVFLILPIVLPLFIAGGAIFGLGREVIESEGTTAEGVFAWYKSKFLTLAAGGTLGFLIVAGPPITLMVIMGSMSGGIIFDGPMVVFSTISAIWILISSGMLSMMFPAIIDGQSSIEAVKTSVRYSIRYFDRVFSTWLAFVVIDLVLLVPMLILNPMFLPMGYGIPFVAYAVLLGVAIVFVVFPAATITLNRVYLILSGDEVPAEAANDEHLEIVGGV